MIRAAGPALQRPKWSKVADVLSAISQAWKSWKSAPGVALLAVVAFAVGIGCTTAIFTVINGVLLRPLPYPEGERFVSLFGARTTEPGVFYSLSIPDAQEFEQRTTSFDVFGLFRGGRFKLTAPGEPHFVETVAVTPALARQLGPPQLGQWFTGDDSAVISSSLWSRLGQRPDIIGSGITIDDRRYTVTGVMPPAFEFPVRGMFMNPTGTEVWLPLIPTPEQQAAAGSSIYFSYARLKPGVSIDQARADARRVAEAIAANDPQRHAFFTADVRGLRNTPFTLMLRPTLLTLLGGAGILLLIACANVATLLLARSVVRARETAIRVALGASRRQLALRYFAEGGLVSVAGAAAGVALSVILTRQILSAASFFVPGGDAITIDWRVLGFSATIATVTGVLAGLAPLWQAMRTAPNAVLAEGVRASASAPARRLSQVFVVVEIALAFMLLTASAILIVHLRNLNRVAPGYEPNGLLTFELVLPRLPREPDADKRRAQLLARRQEQERLMEALRQTPGVTSASFANQLPTNPGCLSTTLYVEGRPPESNAERVCFVATTPDFFSTMRIPLRSGRLLRAEDETADKVLPIVINEAAARTFWPDRDPIGASARPSRDDDNRFDVVGVVGDIRNNGLNAPPAPEMYIPAGVTGVNPMGVFVRSDLPTDQFVAAVRRSLAQSAPALVMDDVVTMNDLLGASLTLERLSSLVMTLFGLAALLMATLGIYGVLSYFVRQRTVEMGTRMALGGVNRDLVTLVLRGGLTLTLSGVAVGSIALIGAVWLLIRFLGVANVGWLPFAASVVVVGLVAAAAGSVPAWRTTLLTPMAAMREEPPSAWTWARLRMQRTAGRIRQVAGVERRASEVSPADVLTAFVDAARGADSYTGALRSVLASVCRELGVESAALLERRGAAAADYRRVAATGAFEAAIPAVAGDGFLITRLRAYPLPLAFAANELATLADWAAEQRPDRRDEIRALADARVGLAVPLRTRTETLGVLLLGERPQHAGFTAHEKQMLRAGADQFALMLENARLTDRVVEQETLRRDIALASDVQRRLLPDAPPLIEGADFAASSLPARRIGGDYYDFVELRDREIGIALADVSGKGVAAALIMSVVQASLRIIASEGDVPLPRLVARMNQFVYRSTPASKYATFFYAQLDEQRRQLRYVNAGHNPPYLLRAGHQSSVPAVIEELSTGGTVVGMFPEMGYEEATVELRPGDILLAFTDGVPEAHNPEDEEFGEERLQQLLRECAHLPADEISARISAEMKNWIRDAEQYDDLTFIVMKVR